MAYKNPPLIESVVEFRFAPGGPWDMTVPGVFYSKVQDQFPKRRQAKRIEATARLAQSQVQQRLAHVDIVQLLDDAEKTVIQVGANILSVHKLKPYSSWDSLFPVVQTALAAYRSVASPRGFTRAAVRYINQIALPVGDTGLDQWFDFYPHTPDCLGPVTAGFVAGVQVPHEDGRDVLRIQLSSTEVPDGGVGTLLDLEYVLTRADSIGLEDAEEWLGIAHKRVGAAFEACIRPPLRERFQ